MRRRTSLPAALAAAALLLSIAGCGDDGSGSDDAAPSASSSASASTSASASASSEDVAVTVAQLKSDVKNAATGMETYFVDNATYPTDVADLATVSESEVTITEADDTSYRLCAVDAASGAWAGFSSDTGTVESGESGGACP